MSIKICFIAPSGYGKTTAVKILGKNFKLKNVKIAEPLYQLQKHFYKKIGVKMRGEQDGELLQFLGIKIRKENANFLTDVFTKKIKKLEGQNQIITNDDCRPPDFKTLKRLGFVFIKIIGFCRTRQDHIVADGKCSLEWQNEIETDYSVENLGSMAEYKSNLKELMNQILGGQK